MMLTLSPFAVDSLTPSYRHSQHPSRASMPFLFSQLQAKGSYMSRPIPVPASISFMHPPLPLSTCQHHLLLQTVHPHHVSEEQHLLLYVATTGLLAVIPVSLHWMFTVEPILSDLVPPVAVLFLLKMKRIGSQQIISNFFKRPDTRR